MKVILLDIEGTTTPIDFVQKTLFPFAKSKIDQYVRGNFDEIQGEIEQVKIEHKMDFEKQIYGRSFDETLPESISKYLKFLIDSDRKSTPLKSLQGKIWKQGYKTGELKSEIFEDVPSAFKRWHSENKIIAIYSSGSVLAQKLLFKYTNRGDLTSFISNYFDTIIGNKKETISYKRILAKFNFSASELLFISDSIEELDAAKNAGFETLLSIREGNAPIEKKNSHRSIQSFDEV